MNNLETLTPAKLKKLSVDELNVLASQIREFLINNITKTGGHLVRI